MGGNVAVVSPIDGRPFLTNATEIFFDGQGNDDGLCQSGEACVYSPNVGAYQGEGALSSGTCTFSDGAVSGVELHGYAVNGD